jgi:RNA polymerase sigma-70 factor (ECF subfamily)
VRGLHRFENRSSLKTWILAILVRRARTVAARQRAATALPSSTSACLTLDRQEAATTSPETLYLEREGAANIDRALSRLAPRQRRVFVLRQVEGRSPGEVDALLGIAPVNQRVLLHRARRRLRSLLEGCEGPTR